MVVNMANSADDMAWHGDAKVMIDKADGIGMDYSKIRMIWTVRLEFVWTDQSECNLKVEWVFIGQFCKFFTSRSSSLCVALVIDCVFVAVIV